jgi:Protein of unknown function (DUF3768)
MGDASRIAQLNDRFRKEPTRWGKAYVTDGVAAHGPEFVARAMAATAAFDAFTADNDPWGERDFGSFQLDGEKLFWKIDYVDKADPDLGAEDPSNPATTARILTIMLADEY